MNEMQARVNITWAGQNADLPDPVMRDALDSDIKAMAAEAVRAGIPGLRADAAVDFTDFVVDRYAPTEGRDFHLIQIRPKTPFGA